MEAIIIPLILTRQGKLTGQSCNFTLEMEGFIGSFTITFGDYSRKNARYRDLRTIAAYYNGVEDQETGDQLRNGMRFDCKHVTDALLFVERNKQWILETMMRYTKFDRTSRGAVQTVNAPDYLY